MPPAIADLTGILAAPGQASLVGGAQRPAARLSVVVDDLWRAEALAEMIADAGLEPEIARTEENSPLVRTALDARLVVIAAEWTRGRSRRSRRSGYPGHVNCGPGRSHQALQRPTAICSGSTHTLPTRIRRSHRQ